MFKNVAFACIALKISKNKCMENHPSLNLRVTNAWNIIRYKSTIFDELVNRYKLHVLHRFWWSCGAIMINIYADVSPRYVTTKDVDVPAGDNPKACAADAANTTLHTPCTNLTQRVFNSYTDLKQQYKFFYIWYWKMD